MPWTVNRRTHSVYDFLGETGMSGKYDGHTPLSLADANAAFAKRAYASAENPLPTYPVAAAAYPPRRASAAAVPANWTSGASTVIEEDSESESEIDLRHSPLGAAAGGPAGVRASTPRRSSSGRLGTPTAAAAGPPVVSEAPPGSAGASPAAGPASPNPAASAEVRSQSFAALECVVLLVNFASTSRNFNALNVKFIGAYWTLGPAYPRTSSRTCTNLGALMFYNQNM